jgi:hypothetical protein
MQAIASLAPRIKVFASSGSILPCAFSAATVSLKFVSFWMASAFLPSASFTLAKEGGVVGLPPQHVDLGLAIRDGFGLGRRSAYPHQQREGEPSKRPNPILARTFDTIFSFQH